MNAQTDPTAAKTDPIDTDCNCLHMPYGDGASFSGYRAKPWPVPGNSSQLLYFRGIKNFDATIKWALENGLDKDTDFVLTGGSAGGEVCSTLLSYVSSQALLFNGDTHAHAHTHKQMQVFPPSCIWTEQVQQSRKSTQPSRHAVHPWLATFWTTIISLTLMEGSPTRRRGGNLPITPA